jgi:nicotinamide-nucleotide amidase
MTGQFAEELTRRAERLLAEARLRGLKLASAESCTGGLVAALLTEIPGSSDVVDRGFVAYSNAAKTEMLGVPAALIGAYGAVSPQVARAMAQGAIRNSAADVAVSITGIAGPAGGTPTKPVGLVEFGCATRPGAVALLTRRYGPIGRGAIRLAAVTDALSLLEDAVGVGR